MKFSKQLTMYIMLKNIPYFGAQSEKLRDELLVLLAKYFSDIKFKILVVNNFVLVTYFIIRMCFLPLYYRLSFTRIVVHIVHLYMSVSPFGFFTRNSQSIAARIPVRVLAWQTRLILSFAIMRRLDPLPPLRSGISGY